MQFFIDWTWGDIAAGEDILFAGRECDGIMTDGSVGIEFNGCALEQISPYCGLSDCHQDIFRIDGDCLILIIFRSESVVFIIDAGGD